MNTNSTKNHKVTTDNITSPEAPNQTIAAKKKGIKWDVWARRDSLMIWEAVALSKNIPPSQLSRIEEKTPIRYRNYESRLKTAISWLNVSLDVLDHPANGEESSKKMILLTDFIRCAREKKLKLPQKMLAITAETTTVLVDSTAVGKQSSKKSPELLHRNQKLQSDAETLAIEEKSKRRPTTKRRIAQLLSKSEHWSGSVDIATIERNILKTW